MFWREQKWRLVASFDSIKCLVSFGLVPDLAKKKHRWEKRRDIELVS
jgi:hypothetical protein